MGSKRWLVPHVAEMVAKESPYRFVDLFAGSAVMAHSLSTIMPVTIADQLSFPVVLGRASLLPGRRASASVATELIRAARDRAEAVERAFADTLAEEDRAVVSGREVLLPLLLAGSRVASEGIDGPDPSEGGYYLARSIFGRGYFSTRQAIALDALRSVIDEFCPERPQNVGSAREGLIAAWLYAISSVVNAPGHTAQFLSARTDASFARLKQYWAKDVWTYFGRSLDSVSQRVAPPFAAENQAFVGEATGVVAEHGEVWPERTLIYADPPYTKDQYSRFYHVLETLYLYDYPRVSGLGRVRENRASSPYCSKRQVDGALAGLCIAVMERKSSLLVSYPANGLLGIERVLDILGTHGSVSVSSFEVSHSTLGGFRGRASHSATENLVLVKPKAAVRRPVTLVK